MAKSSALLICKGNIHFFENKGTEDYRRNGEEGWIDMEEISRPRGIVAKIRGTNRGQTVNYEEIKKGQLPANP